MQQGSLTILVVDDDEVIRKFLVKVLSQYGQCDMARDGHEAVDMYAGALQQGWAYDLVVMDIMMPIMDGMEATERITRMRDKSEVEGVDSSRVLMLSCLDDAEHLASAQFEAGADAYLTKPVEIHNVIEALLGLGLIEGGPDHAKS